MLVLSRRESERIRLGDSIVVTVVKLAGDRVRLGIEAPPDMRILRRASTASARAPAAAARVQRKPAGEDLSASIEGGAPPFRCCEKRGRPR